MNAAEFGLGKYPDRRVVGHSEARLVPGDCVVCNSQASGRSFHEEGPYKMVECISCGHIYTFPRPPQAAVDERYRTSGNWISSSDSLLAAGVDSRYSFLLTLLKRTVPPPAAILDVAARPESSYQWLETAVMTATALSQERMRSSQHAYSARITCIAKSIRSRSTGLST